MYTIPISGKKWDLKCTLMNKNIKGCFEWRKEVKPQQLVMVSNPHHLEYHSYLRKEMGLFLTGLVGPYCVKCTLMNKNIKGCFEWRREVKPPRVTHGTEPHHLKYQAKVFPCTSPFSTGNTFYKFILCCILFLSKEKKWDYF